MKTIKTVMLFGAGQIAVFDSEGNQVPELQESGLRLWMKHAESLGYSLEGVTIETAQGNFVPVKDEGGWNLDPLR